MTKHWARALITGASSGIGSALAQQLAAADTDLVVVARDTARLEAIAEQLTVDVEILTADLSDPSAVDTVADRLRSNEQPVDLLVNNAGLGFAGPTLETSDADDELTVAVNVVALHRLSRAAGRAMAERGGGTILNVSSIAGDMPGPQSGTYNATKAFRHQLQRIAPRTTEEPEGNSHRAVPGADPHRIPRASWHPRHAGAQLRLAGRRSGRRRRSRGCRRR